MLTNPCRMVCIKLFSCPDDQSGTSLMGEGPLLMAGCRLLVFSLEKGHRFQMNSQSGPVTEKLNHVFLWFKPFMAAHLTQSKSQTPKAVRHCIVWPLLPLWLHLMWSSSKSFSSSHAGFLVMSHRNLPCSSLRGFELALLCARNALPTQYIKTTPLLSVFVEMSTFHQGLADHSI